ncbi:MAG: hypothetical protein WBF40_02510, partial [Methyloceanibacter sp.]
MLTLMPIDKTIALAASKAADSPLANHDRTITGVVPLNTDPPWTQSPGSKLAIVLWPIFGPNPHGGGIG